MHYLGSLRARLEHAMRGWFSLFLCGLLLAAGTCLASSPSPYDLALQLRVLSSTPPGLVPGSSGQIEFTIENRWTRDFGAHIHSGDTLIPGTDPLPLRIFTLDGAADACEVQQASPSWPLGNTDVYWFIPVYGVAAGSSVTCRAGFEILAPATRPMSLQFRTGVHSGTSIIWYDVTPWNNIAQLPFGTPAAPVPAGTPAAWLLLAVVLAWLARRQFSGAQRRSRPRA